MPIPNREHAGVAQSVEQLTCNQQVGGSIPFASSGVNVEGTSQTRRAAGPGGAGGVRRRANEPGRFPSGQMEQTVNLSASAFGGSNPPLPTQPREAGCAMQGRFEGPRLRWFWFRDCQVKSASLLGQERRACTALRKRGYAGIAQLVERQPSKLGVAGSSPVSRS